MKRTTKFALALGAVVVLVIFGIIQFSKVEDVKVQGLDNARTANEISREIAFLDAQSTLEKKYPTQAKLISTVTSHEAKITNAGSVYHVTIPVGQTVYACEGAANAQECK